MRSTIYAAGFAAALAVGFGATPAQAGCLTGAAVGGVAGHVAGHGVLGAAAGCAVGHHQAKKHERQRAADRSAASNGQPATSNGTGGTNR